MSLVRSLITGHVTGPVRSLITGLVNSHQLGLPPITPVTGQEEELDLRHWIIRRAVHIVATLVSDHVVTHGDVILEDLGLIAADPHLGRSKSRHRRKRGRRQPSRIHHRTSLSTIG